MAHSRDYSNRSEGSRGGFGRDQQRYRDEENRYRRGGARRDEEGYGRSAEGIGDYGGYSDDESSSWSERQAGRSREDYEAPRQVESFRGEWSDEGSRGGGGYFGTDGGPDFGRAYGSGGQGRFGRGGQFGQERFDQDREFERSGYGSSFSYGQRGSEQGGFGQRGYGGRESQRDYGGQYGGSQYGQYGSQGSQGRSGYGAGSEGSWREERSGGYGSSRGYSGSSGADWQQGSHRGKGPKGYERTDERLKEVICERLADDPRIDASEISIAVSNGVVKLTGTVDSRADKYEVEELIERCGGIKDIDNQLRTQSRQSQQGRQSSTVGGSSGLSGSLGASGSEMGGTGRTEGTSGSSSTTSGSTSRKQ